MTTPNFFLIGAPKCGTTSLATWLSEHDQAFMCTPKEPCFFCDDLKVQRAARDWSEYCRLFEGGAGARAIGEASTPYMRSRAAVPGILERIPDARFVVCLRNPVDMVASVHAQLVRGTREDVRDLRTAIELEPKRRNGEQLPPGTDDLSRLLYAEICALGTQLSRLYELVDRDRVHLVFLDDLKSEPGEAWRGLQAFLGLDDDGRTEFRTENARAMPRFPAVSRLVRHLQEVKAGVAPKLRLGIGANLGRVLERTPTADELAMPIELWRDLSTKFADEVLLLETITGRDLAAWREQPE